MYTQSPAVRSHALKTLSGTTYNKFTIESHFYQVNIKNQQAIIIANLPGDPCPPLQYATLGT
jgi:hypothetical protein